MKRKKPLKSCGDSRWVAGIGVSGLALLGLAWSKSVHAAEPAHSVEFNDSFLRKGNGPVELNYFERGSTVQPGGYDVDVYLNRTLSKRQTVVFGPDAGGDVTPIVPLGLLRAIGVNVARLQKEGRIAAGMDDTSAVNLSTLVTGAAAEFDVNTLSLYISVPQAYVMRTSRGYVDPSLWDEGVPAFYTDYQANYSRNESRGYHSEYSFLGLRNGFNIGGWRFRNESTVTGSTGAGNRFSSNRSYVERSVPSLHSEAALGELYTPGEIFDSARFRGVQIGTDQGMLPDSENGFAPTVRGVAESNAVVEVRQNGYVIYSTTVPPGAFEITDIYPSGSNGDLEIKITEADGRVRQYSQPYAYLPVMVRRGSLRYAVAGGQYRADTRSRPNFAQGTMVYGMSDNFTGYGGILAARNYAAGNLGVGLNTPLGGVSLDITRSQSRTRGARAQGQSLRFLYSKTLYPTNTTFTMVGYRYSTSGYRTLAQHVEDMDHADDFNYWRQKRRLDVNINQPLPRGSMFLGVGETSYWGGGGRDRRLQVGYSGSYKDISYSLAASRVQQAGAYRRMDTQVSLSLSIPLGKAGSSARSYTNAVSSAHGGANVQTGVSGRLNESNTINYGVQAGYSRDGGSSGGASLGWDSPDARLSGNYSQDGQSRHWDVGASGSVVVHGGGVTFGQPLGETIAVVEVPKVKGVSLNGSPTIRTDGQGYAVVPYLQPYRQNPLSIDTSSLGTGTEITDSSRMVVPTRGAVVKARFEAESGRRVQFELSLAQAGKVPFGAMAYDEQGKLVGVVDNQSRLLVFGVKDQGRIDVRWGSDSCTVNYWLEPQDKALSYERRAASCTIVGTVTGAR